MLGEMCMTATIISAVYLSMVLFLFISKKKIETEENKIYIKLILINFMSIAFEVFLYMNVSNYGILKYFDLFYLLVAKLFVCMVFLWASTLLYYTIAISRNKKASLQNKNNKKIGKFYSVFTMIQTIIIFIILVLNVDMFISVEDKIGYSYGPANDFGFMLVFLSCFLMITIILKNRKKLKRAKAVPILLFILLLIVSTIIQVNNPGALLFNFSLSFVTVLMYHTIENPDAKLINQLELARDSAEKANNAKTDFLSSMSHEIRTPLNAIVGFSQCIDSATNLEEAKEDAKDIVMASQNLLEIVNGILDISKIEADKMEIVNTEYSLKEILNNITKLIKTRIGEKDIELKTNFAVDLPDILYGDSGKIKQIMTNILTNAAKYTEQGVIDFTVNCLNNKGKCKLIISVRDTGRGIKQEQIDKLFTKFQRLDEDKNTTTEGTGLGLAITKRLVEMMGGKIVVQSEYGEGSIFTIYITQDIRNSLFEKKEKEEKVVSFDNKKVLIVDDNKLNIKVGIKILREYNFNITTAQSGFECINKIENNEKFDIILLDIMMPKMSGVETLKRLKQIEGFNTPVIALTADALQGKEKKYLEVGFDGYLSKPIDPIQLNRILSRHLDSKEEITKKEDLNKKNSKFEVKILKENNIDVDSSLELLGNMDMYNETLKDFLIESETRLPKMKEHLSNNDADNYAILAHAMKSDSKYLGFKKLAKLSLDHELKGKEDNIKYIKEHYEELMNEAERIINIVKIYLGDE